MTRSPRTSIGAFALALGGLVAGAPAAAQQPAPPAPQLIDRVVAVVGDSVVLESDVQEQLERLRVSGSPVPSDSAELRLMKLELVDRLVNELVLLQAAARDSIIVLPEDVEPDVDARIAQLQQQMGGRVALETALQREGMTVEEYRRTLGESLRRQSIQQQYLARLQQQRRPPPVTDREIRDFFAERGAELGARPATITFRQVVVTPAPSDSARAAALEEVREVQRRLREGEDFEQVARRFTDEPGGRERAGSMGWIRRGPWVPEFERAAFALRAGQVSDVVETFYGFHIIKVHRIRGPEREVSHILIRPEITADARARTRERAERVAERLRAGVPADSFLSIHDPNEPERVGPVLRDSLPAPYGTELAAADEGDVVGPFRVPDPNEPDKWAVVRALDVTEAGQYTAEDEDVRMQIRQFLQREKLIQEVIDDLRDRTYIEIRY